MSNNVYTTIENDIAWITFDKQKSSVNSLDRATLDQFSQCLDQATNDKNVKGIVIQSAKEAGFIAGADITQFTALKSEAEALELVKQAQDIFNKLEAITLPTVALINGHCLGGGYELVLACDYRIALDDRKTRIGLPEVKLGIQPGWGGTVRLPRLVGAIQAMSIILPGKAVSASAAKKTGMVDEAVRTPHLLRQAGIDYVTKKPKKHQPSLLARLSNAKFVRPLLAKKFTSSVAKKVKREHYPAPFAVIDNWAKYGVANLGEALQAEAESISKLFLHDTGRNLVRVFFLQEQLKSLAKQTQFKAKHVHVIGAGTMGGDIAAWCAFRGLTVSLQDQTPEQIAPAIKRAYQLFDKRLRRPHLVTAAMDRLRPDVEGYGVKHADVVIEAIFEDLEVKQKLFKEIEPQLKPDAILASNTSSLPIEEIGSVLKNPSRLVGIHFFNPVAMMMLVEVVRGKNSDQAEIDKALAFVGQIGKLPLPVGSQPGFLINRILMAYLLEAVQLHEEGVTPAVIDKAAVNFGMPMGPVELVDTVGLDVAVYVGDILTQHYGGEVPGRMRELVNQGHLGRKTKRGFYTYRDNKPVKVSLYQQGEAPQDLTDRLILRMVNEAVACLREGVVKEKDLLDAGMIFATGFAPFRGGVMQYVESEGYEKLYQKLQQLEKEHGERFKADKGWEKLIQSHKKEEAASA